MPKFIFLFLLLQLHLLSQERCSSYLKEKLTNTNEEQFTVLLKGNITRLLADQKSLNVHVNYYHGDIASVTVNKSGIVGMSKKDYITYIEYNPNHAKTFNDTMMVRNRIKAVKQGMAPLSQAYDGTGVIVGIMDSGIDFNHPDFKDSNGNTRIQFLWDQTVTSPTTIPQPYNYGQEWTAAQINASLCTHSDLAYYGHGTHVTGIAAGNGLATGHYEGIASNAEIIVVAIDFNSTTHSIFTDAIDYIFAKATSEGKPCVINASVGDYYGSHDATDLTSQMIENMLIGQQGRVLVAAAGNAGNIKFHAKTTLTNTDTLFTWLSTTGSEFYHFIYADTNDIKNVQFSVGANRANYFDLGRIPFQPYNYGISSTQSDTLWYNGNRIGVIKTSASINSSGVYELYLHIYADTLNYLWRIESKGQGKHDSWDFDMVSDPLPTQATYPNVQYYVSPDTISSLVTSFQCSKEVITVGNYINMNTYYDVNNTLQVTTEITGKLKETSSVGPTRTNLIKPDIVASGANIFAAMALGMQTNLITNAPQYVAPGGMHVLGGGTSASSPVVAGLAALYLQAYSNALNQQVKQAIMNCSYSDSFTGTLPNNQYGYGKLDGFAAMLCTIFTGNRPVTIPSVNKLYPNPFTEKFRIEKEGKYEIQIFDSIGKLIYSGSCVNSKEIYSAQIGYYKGLILVKVKDSQSESIYKLIAE